MFKRKYGDGYFPRKSGRFINANYSMSRPRGSTTRRYRRSPKALKALVNKVVDRNEERKESNIYSLGTPIIPTSNASWAASSVRLCPGTSGFPIPNGTGQGNRIGNRITVKKAWVKGIIHPTIHDNVTNPLPQPMQIRMLIFKDKFRPTTQPSALSLDLFQTGSSSIGPQNDLVDCILDPNRDRYQVYHDQILKLGTSNYEGTGASPTQQFWANNDFSYNVKFNVDITRFLPKHIVFNDVETDPMSDGLWMIFLPVRAAGNSFPSTTLPANLAFSANIEYTDA